MTVFFHPTSGFDLSRFAGVLAFMRLPHVTAEYAWFTEVILAREIGQGRATVVPWLATITRCLDHDPSEHTVSGCALLRW